MSFNIQSSEHSPVTLERRIMTFIREANDEFLTESTFGDYKKGLLTRKQKGFKDMNEESEYLFNNLKSFTMHSEGAV